MKPNQRNIVLALPRTPPVVTPLDDYRRAKTVRNRKVNSVAGNYARSFLRRLDAAAQRGELMKPMVKKKRR